jgi:hypothetical protein
MSEVRDRFTVVKAEDDDVFENKATPDGSDVKKGILQGIILIALLLSFYCLFFFI